MDTKNFDKWAKFYDIIYKNQKEDIKFYKKEAKKAKGRVLEVACGTGRIYLELLKERIDVYGIDISKALLDVLRQKAERLGLVPKVYQGDMRNFNLKKKFSLIIVPFRSFLHNLTVEDQLTTLKNLRKHLKPKGRLILNFFFPDPEVIVNYKKGNRKIIKTNKGKFYFINKTRFIDEPNQIVEFSEVLRKGSRTIYKNKFQIAFIYKREFELLLRLSGFKKWRVYGGFNYKPLNSYKQEMIWIIEK